jgi:hypothetical protein
MYKNVMRACGELEWAQMDSMSESCPDKFPSNARASKTVVMTEMMITNDGNGREALCLVRQRTARERAVNNAKWRRPGKDFWQVLGTVGTSEGTIAMKTKYFMAGKPVSRILFSA